jgi:acyl carrier protein
MELPLGPTGKVDRKRLPTPEFGQEAKQYIAPRNRTEEIMCEVWSEVLGLERVGIHDNFFELGGHSLLASRMITRLRHRLQVELPLRSIFEFPMISSLATAAERTGTVRTEANRGPIRRAERRSLILK